MNIGSISPSLHLAPFADERGLADPNTIVEKIGQQLPLADLIRDAFEQGFNKGGVEFVDEDADMEIVGTLLSSELETVDRAGVPNLSSPFALALSFAAAAQHLVDHAVWARARSGGGRPWQRGQCSLERLVRELLRDDYFLLELE